MRSTAQHTPVRFAAWQREYEATVHELDPAKLPGLIRKDSLETRIPDLCRCSTN